MQCVGFCEREYSCVLFDDLCFFWIRGGHERWGWGVGAEFCYVELEGVIGDGVGGGAAQHFDVKA